MYIICFLAMLYRDSWVGGCEEWAEGEAEKGSRVEVWADGWAEGEGEYGFCSLLKQKIKAKNKKKLLRHLQRRNFF